MATNTSPGSVLRGAFLFLLVSVMLLLFFLTLRSLFFLPGSNGSGEVTSSTTEAGPEPAGPQTAVALDGGESGAGGVTCGRPIDSTGPEPFQVEVDDPDAAAEELIIGIALVDGDGGRENRQITVPGSGGSDPRRVTVEGSDDRELYRSCVVTAIQRGQQVILTGR